MTSTSRRLDGIALCRVFENEPPDAHEDDGKPITRLTFARITAILAAAREGPGQFDLFGAEEVDSKPQRDPLLILVEDHRQPRREKRAKAPGCLHRRRIFVPRDAKAP